MNETAGFSEFYYVVYSTLYYIYIHTINHLSPSFGIFSATEVEFTKNHVLEVCDPLE